MSPEAEAFLLGLQDRVAGRPMIAHPEHDDSPSLCDAYGCGYDPRNEMGLVDPEQQEPAAELLQRMLSETHAIIPWNLPRNRCEFPDDGPAVASADVIRDVNSDTDEPDSFSLAMARVEELREAKRADLARRDRAEWECFFHFACENSLLKRQAE